MNLQEIWARHHRSAFVVRCGYARQGFPVCGKATKQKDVQFPLDKGFDIVKAHGHGRLVGTKGVESRLVPIFIQTGKRSLARFGCGGASEAGIVQPWWTS